jgi:hypothetical protein
MMKSDGHNQEAAHEEAKTAHSASSSPRTSKARRGTVQRVKARKIKG